MAGVRGADAPRGTGTVTTNQQSGPTAQRGPAESPQQARLTELEGKGWGALSTPERNELRQLRSTLRPATAAASTAPATTAQAAPTARATAGSAPTVDPSTARSDVMAITNRFRTGKPTGADLGKLAQISSGLQPQIDKAESELGKLNGELSQQRTAEGWVRRTFNDTPEVDALELKAGQVEKGLTEMKATAAGARVLSRLADTSKQMSPSEWKAQIDDLATAAKAGESRGMGDWIGGLTGLVKKQDDLSAATATASAKAGDAAGDRGALHDVTPFYDRWGWLDKLTGGESDRGFLYRASDHQSSQAKGFAQDLSATQQYADGKVFGGVSDLLRQEDPQFKTSHDRWKVLGPAREAVRSASTTADRAQSNLSDAADAVRRRDWVAREEPGTKYEQVKDLNGNFHEEKTSQYRSWESDMDSANSRMRWAISSAEGSVNELNGAMPGVKSRLADAGIDTALHRVDPNISTWFTPFLTSPFSWNSYEGSRVDDIKSDISRLQGRLSQVAGQIEPEYQTVNRDVQSKVSARRQQLGER